MAPVAPPLAKPLLVDDWLSATGCDGRRQIGRGIAGGMSARASNGNWSASSRRQVAQSRTRSTIASRRNKLPLEARRHECACVHLYVWSRPTWARLRLIATSCSKAAIDLRFGRSEHSCVASCRQLRRNAVDLWLREYQGQSLSIRRCGVSSRSDCVGYC